MKAAALTEPGKLQIREIPEPVLKSPDEVLLKIQSVGICGSDRHYFQTGRIGDQVVEYPWIVGHECSAKVLEVGNEVSSVKPGDSVVIDPLIHCGQCSQCRMGRTHTCLNGRFLGCPGQVSGCLAETIVIPQSCCFPFAAHVHWDTAVLTEPLSIALYAVGLMGPHKTEDAVILGAGPIGLCTLLALRDNQIQSLFVTEKISARLEIAGELGALWTGNPDQIDIIRDILNFRTEGVDGVFECCGDQEALDQAIQLLRPGGTLYIIGIPKTDEITFDISRLRRKEIVIQNVRRQNHCLPEAIRWIEENKYGIDRLITHRFSLDHVQEAFDLVSNYQDNVIKAVVKINQE